MTGFQGPPGFVGRPGIKGETVPSAPAAKGLTLCLDAVLQDRKETRVTKVNEDQLASLDPKGTEALKVGKVPHAGPRKRYWSSGFCSSY